MAPKLWEKQPYETEAAYRGFTYYRDLGAGVRTLTQAYKNGTGRQDWTHVGGRWSMWSAKHHWVERAQAWDTHLDNEALRKFSQDRARVMHDMAERHARAAMAMQMKALQRLQKLRPEELSVSEARQFLVDAIRIERMARGEIPAEEGKTNGEVRIIYVDDWRVDTPIIEGGTGLLPENGESWSPQRRLTTGEPDLSLSEATRGPDLGAEEP